MRDNHENTTRDEHARAERGNLDLDGMIVGMGDTACDAAIPGIPISPLGEDRSIALEWSVLGCTDRCAPHVSRNNEVAHHLRGLAHRDARQDFVELLDFLPARLVLHDASVLPKDPEFEVLHQG